MSEQEKINLTAGVDLDEFDNPPDPERVIEGLRDTGYDFNTAIADIVDNSIAAKASKVLITVSMDPDMNVLVFVADDGCGMNLPELCNAMKYGSDRRPDPKSLGKFGLGLKTASTAFCRKLSLISRDKDGNINKVQWDLDYVASKGWKLKKLDPTEDELDILDEAAGDGTGTVVVWEDIDRLFKKKYANLSTAQKALNNMMEKLRFHLSAVYQRFLDKSFTEASDVDIYLNNEAVIPWDPFCKSEEKTELLADQAYVVELPDSKESSFKLRAYAIPRSKTYSTSEAEKNAHISTDTLGFYIYRENRLIHYGDWLGMYVKDPHDSLLRVEFSFDYTLDEAFNVDIKKSRVQLNDQIYNHIHDKFMPAPKRAANEKYRAMVQEKVKINSKDAHSESNRNIDENAASIEGATKVTVTDEKAGKVRIENRNGTFTSVLTIKDADRPGECRVDPADTLEGGCLWEPALIDQKHAVRINKSHPYYQKIYYPALSQSTLVMGMDALLWALAEQELASYSDETQELFEDLRYNISRTIKKLVKDLPDPDIQEDV